MRSPVLQVSSALPVPFRFLALAWRAVRTVPGVWVIRGLFEAFSVLFRLSFLFAFGLLFVVHFANHVEAGGTAFAWPDALLQTLQQPSAFVGVAGVLVVGSLFLFAAESFTFAGMWSATSRAVTGADVRRWSGAWSGAIASFPHAVGIRLLVRCSELTLLAMIAGTLAITAATAGFVADWSGSPLLAPSVTWALILTFGSAMAIVFRLSAELVAAAVYLDDVSLGEGILRAAATVIRRPIYLYRLFIAAAAVLIPPLGVAWLAAIGHHVFVIDAPLLATLLRLFAELAIVAGLVAFSVMMHATFFAYYAWDHDHIDRGEVLKSAPTIELSQLLPERYDHVVSVDQILGPWDDADRVPATLQTPDVERSAPPSVRAAAAYNLTAILSKDEEE